jgi:type VI secretion system protein ImpH
MLGTQRRFNPGVAQRLLTEPHRFEFFQAVRILEHVFVRRGERPSDVVSRRLRFRNSMSLAFPPSEIEAMHAVDVDEASMAAESAGNEADSAAWHAVELTPSFIGMLGTSGVLPLNYTERLAEREVFHRDRAARAFLDIFNNRAVALYYAAWKKYRLALQYELDRKERFLPLTMSLAGLGLRSMRSKLVEGEGAVFDQAISFYCAAVRQRPLSAAFLQTILADYFSAKVHIEQFAGAWYPVPEAQFSRLGRPTAVLGSTALAGERVWQRDLRLRLWFGPLKRRQFEDFLPGGSAAMALAKWLTLLGGNSLEYEVKLVLRAEDVRATGLMPELGGRLGWDAFVCTQPASAPRSDAGYMVKTMH